MPATIEQLTGEVDALTEKVTQLSNLLALLQINGLNDAFDGSGNQTFGGGKMRLDKNGIQIVSPTSADFQINWYDKFVTLPIPDTQHSAFIAGMDSGTLQILQAGAWGGLISGSYEYSIINARSNIGTNVQLLQGVCRTGGYSALWELTFSNAETYGRFAVSNALLALAPFGADPATLLDKDIWYRSDLFRPRIRSNGIVGNLGIEIESAAADAVATGGTIVTEGVSAARVAPTGAVTGVILAVGTTGGQMCQVVNQSAAGNTVTFAVAATSNVANGVTSVIAGLKARSFVWNSSTSLWYPCI